MRAHYLLALSLVLLLGAGAAEAAGGNFGLGIIVGEPTGLSMKNWLSRSTAVDFAAAWSFEGEDALHLHGDFLVHNFSLLDAGNSRLPFYYGFGFRLKTEDEDSVFGVRIPVGFAYIVQGGSLDFFFELGPTMDLAPDTEFHINGGAGLRYYFGSSR